MARDSSNHGGVGVESTGISRERLGGDATAVSINKGQGKRMVQFTAKVEDHDHKEDTNGCNK